MGSTSSKNVSNTTLQAITKVASNIIQDNITSNVQSEIISISNTAGNVIISGNKMFQKININMESLLNAMISQNAQQELSQELTQAAKSLISGVNLFNFSDAENIIQEYLNTTIEIITSVNQKCHSDQNQKEEILVEKTTGDVYITDTIMEQVSDIFQKCLSYVISSNSSIQDIQSKISQSASSETKGINLGVLALIIIGFVAMGIITPFIFSKTQVIFSLFFVAGIVFLCLYFFKTSKTMISSGFVSNFSTNNYCKILGSVSLTKNNTFTPQEAEYECLNNKDCKAYSYHGQNPYKSFTELQDDKKQYVVSDIIDKNIDLYKNIELNNECKQTLKIQDNSIFLPNINIGLKDNNPTEEDSKNYNLFINSSSTEVFEKKNNQLEPTQKYINKLFQPKFSNLNISLTDPTQILLRISIKDNPNVTVNGQYISSKRNNNESDSLIFLTPDYHNNPNNKENKIEIKFSELGIQDMTISKYYNASGYKKTIRNNTYLYLAITLFVIGTFGFIFFFNTEKAKNKNKKV